MKKLSWFEAESYANEGKFIKLPEWTGFWFLKDGEFFAFTAEGQVAASHEHFKDRDDWEVTEGMRDIGGAIKALKSEGSIVKSFKRKAEPNYRITMEKEGKRKILVCTFKNIAPTDWCPMGNDLLAEDYVVVTPELLGLNKIF